MQINKYKIQLISYEQGHYRNRKYLSINVKMRSDIPYLSALNLFINRCNMLFSQNHMLVSLKV